MRFHRLVTENLGPLHGRTVIDWDKDLPDSSLFLLVGPTGAGKSTILDAISLALFGATPRQSGSEGEPRELMSRGMGHALVELEWSRRAPGGRVRFRSTWESWRARRKADGAFQPVIRKLERWGPGDETWTTLAGGSKQKDHKEAFTAALDNMAAEDFQRTVALPQGRFAEFLHANDNDKVRVLERLTDLGQYRAIGRAAQERWQQAGRERDEARLVLGEVKVLGEPERMQLTAEVAARRAEAESLAADVAEGRQLAAWLDEGRRLERAFVDADADLRAAEGFERDAGPLRERIDAHRRASPVHAAQAMSRQRTEEHARLEAQLATQASLVDLERQSVERTAAAVVAAESAAKAARDTRTEAAGPIEAAKQLRAQAQERRKDHDAAEAQRRTAQEDERRAKVAVTASEQVVEGLQGRLRTLDEELKSRQAERDWDGHLPRLRDTLDRLTRDRAEEHAIEGACGRAEAALNAVQERWNGAVLSNDKAAAALLSAEDGLSQRRAALEQRLGASAVGSISELTDRIAEEIVRGQSIRRWFDASTSRDGRLKHHAAAGLDLQRARAEDAEGEAQLTALGEAVRVAEVAVRNAEDAARNAERAEFAARLAEGLSSGAPCPVCGATEHPAPARPTEPHLHENGDSAVLTAKAALDAARERAKAQEGICRSLHGKLQGALAAETAARGSLEEAEANVERFRVEVSGRVGASTAEVERLLLEARRALAASQEAKKALDALQLEVSNAEARRKACEAAALASKEELAHTRLAVSEAEFRHKSERDRLSTIRTRVREEADQLRAGFENLRVSVEDPSLSGLTERLRWMEQRAAEFRGKTEEVTTLRAEAEGARAELEQQRAGLAMAADRASSADMRWVESRARLDEATAAAARALGGRDPDAVDAELIAAAAAAERSLVEANAARDLSRNSLNAAESSLARSRGQLEGAVAALREALEALATALGASAFPGVEAAAAAILEPHEHERLTTEIDRRVAELQRCRTLHERAAQGRAGHEHTRPVVAEHWSVFAADPEAITERLHDLDLRQQAAKKAEGAAENALRQDDANRLDHSAKAEAVERATANYNLHDRLHKLIGTGDGAAFQKYAQFLGLGQLVASANVVLTQLFPRYELCTSWEGEGATSLRFAVRDRFQADEKRPISTLSGGETFVISLALALGLAGTRRLQLQVETLLLDEGFGTLDRDALQQVLAALTELRNRGLRVGIVSHVEVLREQISDQIRLIPCAPGRSRVEVHRS